jgi:hypothetical protein
VWLERRNATAKIRPPEITGVPVMPDCEMFPQVAAGHG